MAGEARLERQEGGLTPVTDGWFVVNVPDAAWVTNKALGAACIFEGDDVSFPQIGFTIAVLQAGQAGGRYHREANQESFLVLSGECLVLVEGEERPLKTWDLFHCPPNTEHAFVGAGDGPCVIFMTGAREGWPEKGTVYPRSELALRHGAGVEAETTLSAEAYAPFPNWQPGRPAEAGELFRRS
jgi:mannose-6-phosphate isomerase-like protein (cupin superfamily)